ncbi:beta-eliminating lyase-related protein [Alphaproteobacteria bacterium]|nr:beta-eliminating lyase-related protein [Alphaproteobacteria bacterium]
MNRKTILMGTDTISGIAPEIINSIISASDIKTLPYGNDVYTKECKETICKIFEKDNLEIIPMMSGTASNSLAISSFLPSYGSILCHDDSHINKDEGGAPEFFSGGGKLLTISSNTGKLKAKHIEIKIDKMNFKSKKSNKISGVSITQLAENGTIYKKKEILAISKICKNNNMFLHMDGARFANALAYQNISPADSTWKLGVDCLSLGATKNGAMAAEVIIFFNTELFKEAKHKIKQTGHVIPKTRFISAQLNAWFKDKLWLKLADSANQKACYLSEQINLFKDFELLYPTEGNEVFFKIENKIYDQILKLNIIPNLWSKVNDDQLVIRFVTSFETQISEIRELLERLSHQFEKN